MTECQIVKYMYCKFRNNCENFIFANSVKTNIFDIQNWRQELDLPIPVNDRVISPILEDFIFVKLPICEVSRK